MYGMGRPTCLLWIGYAYDHRGSLPIPYMRLQTAQVDTTVNPGGADPAKVYFYWSLTNFVVVDIA